MASYAWIGEIWQPFLGLFRVKKSLNARFQKAAKGYITDWALW